MLLFLDEKSKRLKESTFVVGNRTLSDMVHYITVNPSVAQKFYSVIDYKPSSNRQLFEYLLNINILAFYYGPASLRAPSVDEIEKKVRTASYPPPSYDFPQMYASTRCYYYQISDKKGSNFDKLNKGLGYILGNKSVYGEIAKALYTSCDMKKFPGYNDLEWGY